ncbi:MAG: DUF6326 family protein [Ilumatobacter sp.]|uniref:DUF6326 family protein n=1 Tax=Ilumatobacter sp. TaxID=1967498 RepID=UPI0039193E17
MSRPTSTVRRLAPLDPRLKISALWISTLFVFAYVDVFSLYRPDVRARLDEGKVHEFAVSETFLFLTTLYIVIPSLMVALTLLMPAVLNRNVNIAVAAIYIFTIVGSAIGDWWYFVFGSVVEAVLLIGVILVARSLTRHRDDSPEAAVVAERRTA